ncbi:MAG: H-type small acid-soluble spore protein [Vallitalea sp.]|jgi:small acid-soluble spore protein H (minor)|nr:H-type small acid-soluble spore protein [Vallitalea sp.]
MDTQRAKEISTSLKMANVTYNGSNIYIEQVNDYKNSASIHFLNNPQSSQEVSLNDLIEH